MIDEIIAGIYMFFFLLIWLPRDTWDEAHLTRGLGPIVTACCLSLQQKKPRPAIDPGPLQSSWVRFRSLFLKVSVKNTAFETSTP
jgi:hypothetical protein